METATAETTPETAETPIPEATLASRLRARWDGYRASARELPTRARELPIQARAQARARALALVTRVRIALDLPSRSEIAELTARLEDLDRRIGELAGGHVTEVPSLEAAAGTDGDATDGAGAEEPAKAGPQGTTQRKDKRRTAAAKTSRR
jgi:hypothetical protein